MTTEGANEDEKGSKENDEDEEVQRTRRFRIRALRRKI